MPGKMDHLGAWIEKRLFDSLGPSWILPHLVVLLAHRPRLEDAMRKTHTQTRAYPPASDDLHSPADILAEQSEVQGGNGYACLASTR